MKLDKHVLYYNLLLLLVSVSFFYLLSWINKNEEAIKKVKLANQAAEGEVYTFARKAFNSLYIESVVGDYVYVDKNALNDPKHLPVRVQVLLEQNVVDKIAIYSKERLLFSWGGSHGNRFLPRATQLKGGNDLRLINLDSSLFIEAKTALYRNGREHIGYMLLRKRLDSDALNVNYHTHQQSTVILPSVDATQSEALLSNFTVSEIPFNYTTALNKVTTWNTIGTTHVAFTTPIYFSSNYEDGVNKATSNIAAYLLSTASFDWFSLNYDLASLSLVLIWALLIIFVVNRLIAQLMRPVNGIVKRVRNNMRCIIEYNKFEPLSLEAVNETYQQLVVSYNQLLMHVKDTRVAKNEMLLEIGQRKRLQDELHRYKAQLEHLVEQRTYALKQKNALLKSEISEKKRIEQKRRELSNRLLVTQEEERKQLSRELHDGVGPLLMVIKMKIQLFRQQCEKSKEFSLLPLVDIIENTQQAINDVRKISKGLRPVYYDDGNIDDLLTWYADEFEEVTGIKVEINKDESIVLPSKVKDNLFRVFQEALNNAHKHAKASRVTIQLLRRKTNLLMTIADNGIGLDASSVRTGIGFYTMEERVSLINGTMDVNTGSGSGVQISIQLPLTQLIKEH
ncbi:hypothetical protein HG263_09210 [Pseudoalteromonas sp. JBTF-M23]|uniref:histidine kinase n=1 Tax=Pseudoalteromonas caenipelagi TaxID=2726988 RepID=A0A849VDT2_9GAMM|nr:sensor histidine kinase [Pseudoalteromonas caenipelagi]NOU50713.1 hypothetical protein [Pseudoalteromonas caenipelagi]